eukprot:NODE_3088_length_414_cov_126.643836_g2467_i0.p1 GENE.NODE_3088_length_414_cov_126.643836_g2467_i0~~NODE_3088_length_414_cov_126.643836_g2467_i0.p1  ORF type:complete len:84 (-),score=2.57 NODE_3088_length_414_cov_126.643836_g2467_i0:3-254(-)
MGETFTVSETNHPYQGNPLASNEHIRLVGRDVHKRYLGFKKAKLRNPQKGQGQLQLTRLEVSSFGDHTRHEAAGEFIPPCTLR